MTKHAKSWAERPVDPEFLHQSGLLFEINRTVLHLIGVALVVVPGEGGRSRLAIKDSRCEPERLVFDAGTFDLAQTKLRTFMVEYGNKQLERRRSRLGYGCQGYPPRKKT